MKRTRSNTKYKLGDEQRTFLRKLLSENIKMTPREIYVVNTVLKNGEYHDNYKYHLNNIGKRYKDEL
jgi:hypothetical protein